MEANHSRRTRAGQYWTGSPAQKPPADGDRLGPRQNLNEQGLVVDVEPRLAVADVNPHAPEAEGDPAVPTIVPVAPMIRQTVTSAIDVRPAVNSVIDSATVTNSWLDSPKPSVTLRYATLSIEEKALATPIFGLGGGGGDRRHHGESGDGGEQRFRHVNLLLVAAGLAALAEC
jgi:hypothetical protein